MRAAVLCCSHSAFGSTAHRLRASQLRGRPAADAVAAVDHSGEFAGADRRRGGEWVALGIGDGAVVLEGASMELQAAGGLQAAGPRDGRVHAICVEGDVADPNALCAREAAGIDGARPGAQEHGTVGQLHAWGTCM